MLNCQVGILLKMRPTKLPPPLERWGTVPKLAKALGITVTAVHRWKKIPKVRAYQISELSGGEIKVDELTNLQIRTQNS